MKTMIENEAALLYIGCNCMSGSVILTRRGGGSSDGSGKRLAWFGTLMRGSVLSRRDRDPRTGRNGCSTSVSALSHRAGDLGGLTPSELEGVN